MSEVTERDREIARGIIEKWASLPALASGSVVTEHDVQTQLLDPLSEMLSSAIAGERDTLARRVQRLEQAFDNLPTFLRSARDDVWKSPQCETRRMALRTLDQAMDYLSEKKAALAEEAE